MTSEGFAATSNWLKNLLTSNETIIGIRESNPQPFDCEVYALSLTTYIVSAAALRQLAEGYGQLAEIKDNLDTGVQQNFLDPLSNLENKEIKLILVSVLNI